jgi:hypothetical protein
MKKICAMGILLTCFSAVAQAPSVICPIHNVPAQITGHTKTDGEGRTIAWEYCHSGVNTQHCFWAHD